MSRYVGARYVPVPMGDWDNSVNYEPLSMVTVEGDTYISKKYVPAGIAVSNTAYWAKMSVFSQQLARISMLYTEMAGQITDVIGDVDSIEDDIDTLQADVGTWLEHRSDTVATNSKMKETSAWFHTFNVVATKQLNSGATGQVEIDVSSYLTDGDISYYMIGVAGFQVNGDDYVAGIELSNNSKLVRVHLHNNTDQAHEVGATVTVQCINRHLIPTA